jgi:hypothetical protein
MKNQIGEDFFPITPDSPEEKFPGLVFYQIGKGNDFDPAEGLKHPWFVEINPNVLLPRLLGENYKEINFNYYLQKGNEVIVTNGIVSLKVLTWACYDPEDRWGQFIIIPL